MGAGTLIFAIVMIWAFRGNNVPIIPDEIGYLAIANYLATGEAMNLSSIASYRFGQGVMLLPAFWIGTSDAEIYRYGVAISCIQTALIPVVLLGIAKRMDFNIDWRVVVASFLVTIFPAYFYQNSVVWPETTFRLFFLVLIYLVAAAWQTKRPIWWILMSICLVWLYALHSRALGIIPVTLVLILSGRARGKLTSAMAMLSIAIAVFGAWLVGFVQKELTEVLWGGTAHSDAGQIKDLVRALLTPDAFRRVLTVAIGHAWSLTASSLGLFLVGICAAWIMLRQKAYLWPVLLFSGFSTIIIFAASVAQMAAFSRIDHLVYSRYNDAASTFFVWLGLMAALRISPLPKHTALFTTSVLAGLGLALATLANGYQLIGIVSPNIPALIWTNDVVPFSATTLALLAVLGTAAALICVMMFFALPIQFALAFLAVFVATSDFIVKRSAWQAHNGREAYLQITGEAYGKVGGTIYWDRSSAGYGDNLIDQYMAVSKPMPWSDIAQEDINLGDATIADADMKKDGYTCIARLPNNSKLLQRGPGPDDC